MFNQKTVFLCQQKKVLKNCILLRRLQTPDDTRLVMMSNRAKFHVCALRSFGRVEAYIRTATTLLYVGPIRLAQRWPNCGSFNMAQLTRVVFV